MSGAETGEVPAKGVKTGLYTEHHESLVRNSGSREKSRIKVVWNQQYQM